ncbi:LysM peptidoglycan-binding domain-containing protein [Pelomonas cellulosilytica]|uniref:LysM peptidoglycan-binding domain-containing protein n=1 Tax=Pelomonas cellulosilytica TaxID=2906762 RepID=A0ABS8XV73_9BURK|nr:LysM peptidoglycan-binding domain-containing protein [Pelomonas sp. P8]MCE4555803.1 LysM peptidoglycan-binding domain-containing protein [Pelomonas sp. P8]
MFLPNSRYAQVATVTTTLATGETVVALKRRQLTPAAGAPRSVVSGDRLDVIADQQYAEATWFWHIADANTDLDSRDLLAEPGDTLHVPQA